MHRRLLDRLGQWVKCEPNFAGMWDCPLPGDDLADCSCGFAGLPDDPTALTWTAAHES